MIEIKNITKIYRTKGEFVTALKNVSLRLGETGMVFLLGKSGSGKSTLLNLIGGLDRPDSGEIVIRGRGSSTFRDGDFDSYRNTYVGFIFQEYNLLEEFSVEDNVALALELQNRRKDKAKIEEILSLVELSGYGHRKPNTLSGGQKQRVAIARALVKDPQIIMADEPTGALDSETGRQVLDTLKKLSESKLVIVVSHDREFAETYGDRIIELKDGEIISDLTRQVVKGNGKSGNVVFVDSNTVHIADGSSLSDEDFEMIHEFIISARTDVTIVNNTGEKSHKAAAAGTNEVFAKTDESRFPVREYTSDESKFIRSRLPLRHAVRLGASSLKVKPFRLFFTILLTFIAFTMFGLFSTLMLFNEEQIMAQSLKDADYEYLVSSKIYSYIQRYNYGDRYEDYGPFTANAMFKREEAEKVWEELDKDALFVAGNGAYSIANLHLPESRLYTTRFFGFAVSSADSSYRSSAIIYGKYPENSDEIMISDYMFDCLRNGELYNKSGGDSIPYEVNDYEDLSGAELYVSSGYGEKKLCVCGVYRGEQVPSHYTEDYLLENKTYFYNQSMFYDGLFAYAIVSDKFVDENQWLYQNTQYIDDSMYFDKFSMAGNIFFGDTGVDIYGYSSFPAGFGRQSFDVYGLDGKKLSELPSDGIAVNSSVIAEFLQTVAYETADEAPETYAAWCEDVDGSGLTAEKKLELFRNGINTSPEGTVLLTEEQRLQYFREAYEVLAEYDGLSLKCDVIVGSGGYGGAIIGGFYFSGNYDFSNYIYAGNMIDLSLKNYVDMQGYKRETITKYDMKGELYGSFIIPSSDSVIDRIIALSYNFAEDDSAFYPTGSICSLVRTVADVTSIFSKIFLGIGIAFALFSMLLLFNFISVSILNKKKEIGILRAVGARSADVFKIFYSESFIISGTCLILSAIVSAVLCALFNSLISEEFAVVLSMFVFGPVSLLMLVGIALATSVISTFLPVYSIAKKRPVESIRAL